MADQSRPAAKRHAARHSHEAVHAPEVPQDPERDLFLDGLDRALADAFEFGDASHDPGLRYGPVTR